MDDFFSDMYKRITGKDINLGDVSFGDIAAVGGTAYLANKLGDGVLRGTNKPPVGYQGGIDRLTKVRDRVNVPFDQDAGRATGLLTGRDQTGSNLMMKTIPDPDNQGETIEVPMTEEELGQQRMQGDKYARSPGNRRPGGMGRRYFTDRIYAKTPEEDQERMSLDDARKQSMRQKLAMEGKSEGEIEDTIATMAMGGSVRKYAQGGIAAAHNGYYLGGKTDGMADKVPARIDGKQEARLSDGEFVIPADVVSHLGNGNSDAGAQQLHSMMDNVRTARTGNPEQGKQIDPQKFMPKMAQGGLAQFAGGGKIKYLNAGGDPGDTADPTDPMANSNTADGGDMTGTEIGTESSLSSWAGDYVTDMLSYGRAEAESPYEAYTGPLTAGSSVLQDQAFTGIQALNNPLSRNSITRQMGAFEPTGANVNRFMSPYEQNVIDRTAADMRRQSQIDALQDRTAMTTAGAFGGSRDALMRAERANNLSRNIGDMAAQQRAQGFNTAMDRAQQRQQEINRYGLDVLAAQGAAGQVQRDIASEGIAADYGQFREERDYDKKAVQYMQSLLQGLPIAATQSVYSEPSELQQYLQSVGGIEALIAALGGTEPETT